VVLGNSLLFSPSQSHLAHVRLCVWRVRLSHVVLLCVVSGAVNFVAAAAPFFRLLPLTQVPDDISSSRTFHQLRRLFHGAADPLVRCAALYTLVRLQCPGFVQVRVTPTVMSNRYAKSLANSTHSTDHQDVVERCAQETDADVLAQLYRAVANWNLTMPAGQTASSLESLVEAAQHGLNVRVRSVACHEGLGRSHIFTPSFLFLFLCPGTAL
jgi:hypothetical protein